MSTNICFWSYLVHLFLWWEMSQTNVVEKFETQILCSITMYRKSCRVWDNVEKYGRAGQATHEITWRMRIACCVPKTHTLNMLYLLLIHYNNGCTKRASMLRYTLLVLCHSLLRMDVHDSRPWELQMTVGVIYRRGLLTMKFSDISYIQSYYQ
jgi:hypothetical protein